MNFHPGHPKTDRRFAPLRLFPRSRWLDRIDVAEEQDRNDLLGQLADKHRFALLGESLYGIGQAKALHQRLPVGVMFAYDSRDTQEVELGDCFAVLVERFGETAEEGRGRDGCRDSIRQSEELEQTDL
jgi:hypothetical protein